MWLYFVKTIVNSLRQEYLHYGWEGVAKETWFYTINFWDCLNGLIRDMSNQLWVIIIIGKILRGFRHRKYFRSSPQRIWGRFWLTNTFKNHGRVPRENKNLRNELTLKKVLEIPRKNKFFNCHNLRCYSLILTTRDMLWFLVMQSNLPEKIDWPRKSNRVAGIMN